MTADWKERKINTREKRGGDKGVKGITERKYEINYFSMKFSGLVTYVVICDCLGM
jgi:hypothetical protein